MPMISSRNKTVMWVSRQQQVLTLTFPSKNTCLFWWVLVLVVSKRAHRHFGMMCLAICPSLSSEVPHCDCWRIAKNLTTHSMAYRNGVFDSNFEQTCIRHYKRIDDRTDWKQESTRIKGFRKERKRVVWSKTEDWFVEASLVLTLFDCPLKNLTRLNGPTKQEPDRSVWDTELSLFDISTDSAVSC